MNADQKLQAYLWDPAAFADADVAAVEETLSPLAFDPAAHPLPAIFAARDLPAPRGRMRWRRPVIALAVAASLLFAAGAGLWSWRWSWPDGRAWTVRAGGAESRLEVGRGVAVPSGTPAIANIARIGTMRLGGGTSLELRATRGNRHRLRMDAGALHVRLWAPPGSIVIETPAGDIVDMGCEFNLSVDGDSSRVRVVSGWVQIENRVDEVLIPAGASSEMTSMEGPGVPVFDDAAGEFREAVRAIEGGAGPAAVDVVLRLARARDVYTLLQIADRHPRVAEPVLRRAAELAPPPGDVTIGAIMRGDRDALWQWTMSLPLPSPKSGWWRNWRDALPLGLK